MSANMLLTTWANRGVNLWAVDKFTVTLVAGTQNYTLDPQVVSILDAYVTVVTGDRILSPMSRSEFASLPVKTTSGTPVNYWLQREITPVLTLYPVPNDGSDADLLRAASGAGCGALGRPERRHPLPLPRSLRARAGVARRGDLGPDKAQSLKALADESYTFASGADVENVNLYITPMMGGYYRQ
jgi:hypothetical protein